MKTIALIFLLFAVNCALLFRLRRAWLLLPASLLFVALLAETTFLVREKIVQPNRYHYKSSKPYKDSDPELRSRFIPGVSVQERKYYDDGVTIYEDISYTFDDKGRRRSCSPPNDGEYHALFFGGSFTFGMGVNDNETLPSRFSKGSGGIFRSYNLGAGGFGMTRMLIQLQRDKLLSDVQESAGIAVYSFIPQHLTRSTGFDLYTFCSGFKHNPVCYLDKKTGALIGPMKYYEYPRLRRAVAMYERITWHSAFLRFAAQRAHPKFISEESATRVAARIVGDAATLYQRRFHGHFIVLIWPRSLVKMDPKNVELFSSLLSSQGITVLTPPAMPDADSARIHPRDGHPSAEEYKYVASKLQELVSHQLTLSPQVTESGPRD